MQYKPRSETESKCSMSKSVNFPDDQIWTYPNLHNIGHLYNPGSNGLKVKRVIMAEKSEIGQMENKFIMKLCYSCYG